MHLSFSSPLLLFAAAPPFLSGCFMAQPDEQHLPCSGFSRRTSISSYTSRVHSRLDPIVEAKFVCRATWNPDSPRHKKRGQPQNRNRQSEEIDDDFLDLEGNGMLDSKNGQATSTPEKGRKAVEMFMKVQNSLRNNVGSKMQVEDRASIAVSFLDKLRKHQAKESNNSHDSEHHKGRSMKVLDSDSSMEDEPEQGKHNSVRPASKLQKKSPIPRVKYQSIPSIGDKYAANSESPGTASGKSKKNLSRTTLKLDADVDDDAVRGVFVNPLSDTESELEEPVRDEAGKAKHNCVRPLSKFQKRSPVPRVKYQPFTSIGDEHAATLISPGTANGNAAENLDQTTLKKADASVLAASANPMSDTEPESELEETGFKDNDVFLGKANGNGHHQLEDLKALKLQELRKMVKSRGLKGTSKLKKHELALLLLSNC